MMRTWISGQPAAVHLSILFVLCTAACGGAVSPDATAAIGSPPPDPALPLPGDGTSAPVPGGDGGVPDGALEGGVLVTLVDSGERFRIWVTEPQAASTLVDIRDGKVAFTNITGPLRSGPGEAKHNAPWSWHLDPTKILVNIHTFAPVYSEKPSVVERDLASLLAKKSDKMASKVGSTLESVEDYRTP